QIDSLLFRMDAEERLRNGMDELDERDKNLLIYKYSYDMSYKEISDEMCIPEGNIGAYIKRAKNRFKEKIKKD
ncbi:MAG: sigma-70 family RNA polymerase sigma factor, partial [Eubacterium sp.]|nr:sigma-70 family RNA polymerase sigma factor [Eubacterium sp.]